MILQLNPPIEVSTPLGRGWTLFLIDYGLNVNTIWLVRLENGKIKHFDANDILIIENEMLGQEKINSPANQVAGENT